MRVVRIIGISFIVSLLIYSAMVYLIFSGVVPLRVTPISPELYKALYYLFLGIAVLTAYPITLFRGKREEASPDSQQFISYSVLAFAFCESAILYGFVLFFLGGSFSDYVAFAAMGVLYFFICWPSGSEKASR